MNFSLKSLKTTRMVCRKSMLIKIFLFSIVLSFFTWVPNIKANPNDVTVEGDMTRFATGVAYPSILQFAGYNTQTQEVYYNIGFEGGDTATDVYDYEINIYQGDTGSLWAKSAINSTNEGNPADSSLLEEKNILVQGTTDLQVGHRTVVTVLELTDN